MFNIIKAFIFSIVLLTPAASALASDVNVYFFQGEGCPHCTAEKEFFKDLKKDTTLDFNLREYEIWYNKENQGLLEAISKQKGWQVTGAPFTIIGDIYYTGYLNDETTGKKLANAIKQCNQNECPDTISEIIAKESLSKKKKATPSKSVKVMANQEQDSSIPKTLDLPLFGTIQTEHLSLPVITIIIAALDGFNPCAMWILIFLISLLLGTKSKKRRWIFGGTFILASGLVYFLFLTAWLNIILFIGVVAWVRNIIGIVALATAFYSLRDYHQNKTGVCKVTNSEKRQLIFDNLKKFVQEKSFWLALGGLIVLAAAVNLVELLCSAGLPAIFTQILALSNLSSIEHYSYMLLYIIIFMLDDMLVFVIAMKTLEIKSVGDKFNRYSTLIGGIVMLILGLLLLFAPNLLMFG